MRRRSVTATRRSLPEGIRRRGLGPLGAVLALTLTLGMTTAARADEPSPEEIAAARALFNDGKDDEKANAWRDALAKFKKVGSVKMTPQVRFHIALCEENLGHLVAAINGFEIAGAEAAKAGKSAADVATNAPPRAEALRKRVPILRLHVAGHLGGRLDRSKILLDGTVVVAALLDTDIPVDPGKHVVDVLSDGERSFRREIALRERETQTIEVEVRDSAAPRPSVSATAPPVGPPPPAARRSRLPEYIAGGVGVAALVGAGVFLGMRQGAIAEVRSHCTNGDSGCDPNDYATSIDGERYGTVSGVLLGVGLAGLATAGVLFVVRPAKKPGPLPARTSLRLAPTVGGAYAAGTF